MRAKRLLAGETGQVDVSPGAEIVLGSGLCFKPGLFAIQGAKADGGGEAECVPHRLQAKQRLSLPSRHVIFLKGRGHLGQHR